MLQSGLLQTGHADLVTHVTYDFYGERLATCSADQKIMIFRKTPDNTWDRETGWKAHDAPILHLSFSHPVHGSLLASSSHDRSVRIWEEPTGRERDGRWIERAVLTGAKGSVKQVEFGTADSGSEPRVATISTDSYLRIYTSADPSLSDWTLLQPIYIPSLPQPGSTDETPVENSSSSNELANGGWGLSWCKERWWGSIIAAFSGISPIIKILSIPQDSSSSSTSLIFLNPPQNSSQAPLTSISWAPSCGRAYHLIASGSRDGTVRIWRLEPPGEKLRTDYNDLDGDVGSTGGAWKGECVADFGKGGARVGMVDWNATGTTLTTTDDEGIVRIYKPTYARSWKLLGQMSAEEPPNDDSNGH
ncbi:uncharacterized protein I206_103654 [Kwoniella pini CBS 10737]|uniref:Nucleoporin SEH1 n=1 Tax=Kwoniella pini CBS 10737 TaxID=1296096 RepID=A0A1B9I944_9TREE|nr:uncharacterized protein I206_01343 [Kwoniella pini CBS 10737]OCF52059.1 hypothetical protein I206_01343 [Kwoniella pini CBS 10737]